MKARLKRPRHKILLNRSLDCIQLEDFLLRQRRVNQATRLLMKLLLTVTNTYHVYNFITIDCGIS